MPVILTKNIENDWLRNKSIDNFKANNIELKAVKI